MRDNFEREITYLRVSVTDRCNLRCFYCRPAETGPARGKEPEDAQDLEPEYLLRVIRAGAQVGIRKVRLTGGEPLLRADILEIVRGIASVPGIDDLALTTNGTLLAPLAGELRAAGLRRVNISLDTLNPDRFRRITRGGELRAAWAGVMAALEAGLTPVRLNVVAMRGINDDESIDLALLTRDYPLHVRFIELMPIGEASSWAAERLVPVEELLAYLEASLGRLVPQKTPRDGGPARYWRLEGAPGTIGFIAPMSGYFCSSCNRLRLTAAGTLRPCLCQDGEVDLRPLLRRGASEAELAQVIAEVIRQKPRGNEEGGNLRPVRDRLMSEIGG
ncbi:MAG: GTP 3',8-cyclase MoaA [Bacillota bacterium]